MKKLESFREEIDTIDSKMKDLFLSRMKIVKKIKDIKKENNLAIFDKDREKKLFKKNFSSWNSEVPIEFYRDFLIKVVELSKEYQKWI